jgi:HAE1 family hydrophobic/amphiphilic exporter-1
MRRTILAVVPFLVVLRVACALDNPLFPRISWFRQHFGPSSYRVQLQPPAYLSDHVVGGRVELSLRSYLELVLENNTDIALAKLLVVYPANAVTRAFAAFDPSLQSSFSSTWETEPTTSALQGGPVFKSVTEPASFTYQQLLPSGTALNLSFDAQRYSTNSIFSTYNPALSSNFTVQLSYALLQNRGALESRLTILVAKSNLTISRHQLQDQVSNLLASAENAYWDAVQARENIALQTKFLELRAAALDRVQKQVDAGALLPLELFQPKANYASAQVAVIQATQALSRAENALRQQIGADLDPRIRTLPIVLTEPYAIAPMPLPEPERTIATAIARRPDLSALMATVDKDDLSVRSAADALRPYLLATGTYTSQGVGGIYNELSNPFGSATVVTQIPGGFGDAVRQMFGFGYPVYSMGIQLSLPLRDRAAGANLADAQTRKRQDSLLLRKLEQTVRLQVLDAIGDLKTIQASLQQAEVAREFAQKRFEAEQKKYELGVTQLFFVLDAQTQLNQAENDTLLQAINYRRSVLAFHLIVGDLLSERGVTVQ